MVISPFSSIKTQLAYYSAKIFVNLETALKVAKTFAESKRLEI
jgi:hypothetical protein